ncbi:MAG: peroxiredoxin [Propionibacteriaceae bacterium]|nr:peroxiredoxin [Propionibacteriaceae bacterium]
MATLAPGDAAPDFRLQDATQAWVSLKDCASRALILYFYPAALTPGCTVEAQDFTTATPVFDAAGYTIMGVSPDAPSTLARFIERHDLTLRLLSDPDRETLKAYGAWGDRMLYGKVVTGVIRTTFVIDVDALGHGTIREAHYNVRATGHVKRLRASLGLD